MLSRIDSLRANALSGRNDPLRYMTHNLSQYGSKESPHEKKLARGQPKFESSKELGVLELYFGGENIRLKGINEEKLTPSNSKRAVDDFQISVSSNVLSPEPIKRSFSQSECGNSLIVKNSPREKVQRDPKPAIQIIALDSEIPTPYSPSELSQGAKPDLTPGKHNHSTGGGVFGGNTFKAKVNARLMAKLSQDIDINPRRRLEDS